MTTDGAPLTGLARARELLAKAEDQRYTQVVPAMAAQAAALASVELAAATQLAALIELTRTEFWIHDLVPDERLTISRHIRIMLGLTPDAEPQGWRNP